MPDQKPTLEYELHARRPRQIVPYLILAITPVLHVTAIVLLYRARHAGATFANSDGTVFALPTALAFASFVFALVRSRWSATLAVLISVAATFVSFWIAMLVSLNAYGS